MAVTFCISRGKEENDNYINTVRDSLKKRKDSFCEIGIKSKVYDVKHISENDNDYVLMYDVEKYGDSLEKSLIRTLNNAYKYKDVYIFIEVLDSGYDFTQSPLYNTYR